MGSVRLPIRLNGRRLLVAIAALALTSCGAVQPIRAPGRSAFALDATSPFAQDAAAELPQRLTYRIGINTEVTGTGAQIGDLSIRAARLAVEEINAAGGVGGRPLELVVRDCRSDPVIAVDQYRRAIAEDGLVALLGPLKSAYAVRIVPEHRGSDLPMLIGATNVTLTAQGDANLFRMRPSDGLTAAAITALAVDRLGARRIAIIHDSDAFGTGGADNISAGLAQRDLVPVAREQYSTGSTEFGPLVQAVAAARPDSVLIYGTNPTDVGLLLRAIRYWKLGTPIVTSPGGASAVTHNVAADAQDGVYVAMDTFFDATPTGHQFAQTFMKRFGIPPDTYIAWYYDAIYLLAGALRAHGDDMHAIGQALRSASYQGVQGNYRFDQRGDGLHEVMLAQIAGGQPRLIGTYGATGLVYAPNGQRP
jgi:branched-chain amino acid transport system substrate-binding protein